MLLVLGVAFPTFPPYFGDVGTRTNQASWLHYPGSTRQRGGCTVARQCARARTAGNIAVGVRQRFPQGFTIPAHGGCDWSHPGCRPAFSATVCRHGRWATETLTGAEGKRDFHREDRNGAGEASCGLLFHGRTACSTSNRSDTTRLSPSLPSSFPTHPRQELNLTPFSTPFSVEPSRDGP